MYAADLTALMENSIQS